jgi:CIC family chloride channel protein
MAHEQWLVFLLAGIVGVYAGLAAGLFANAISLFGILLFETKALRSALLGDPAWHQSLRTELLHTDWNPSFLLVGVAFIAGALGLARVVSRNARLGGLAGAARVLKTVAILTGVGIALYYPLLALRALNQSFGMSGDLLSLLERTPWPLILLVPALGGLGSGLIVQRMTPTHTGHGVSEVMEAVARNRGIIPKGVVLWKALAAAICTGAGGSVGREGPLAQIGAGVGSGLGQWLGLGRGELNVLVGAGAAAGIAASFNAPIAGAMFALEIVLGEFGIRTFSPIVFASVMGTVTARTLLGTGAEVTHASYTLVSGLEILPYAGLGIVCGLLSIAYMLSLSRVEHAFRGDAAGRLGRYLKGVSPALKPALGGLALGCVGLVAPRLLGTGYPTMNAALTGQLSGPLLAGICLGKIVATSLTLGSGGQGGSFFPATFIGAAGGGAFGAFVHSIAPRFTAAQGAYALVGMGAVVAGATQGPLTGIVMLFELTGDYEIILPLMVACILSTSLVRLVMGGSLYTLKLRERGIATYGARDPAVLRSLRARAAMEQAVTTVREDAQLADVLKAIAESRHTAIPVVDAQRRLTGII